MPGLVTLVATGGDVHVDVLGTPSFADPAPLARDAIFRVASLTKPITAATTMSLVDDGVLRLEGAIDDLVPELADRRVLRAIDAELDDTVPAHRSITVEDLLSFRMGFGSVMAPPGTHPIQRAIDDYRAVVSMLGAGGTRGGERILSARSVALMTTDRLTPAQRGDAAVFLGEHGGWGLGMGVPATGATGPLPCGFGWEGGSGTAWRTDPERGVTGILLTQREITSPEPPPMYDDFWTGVNAATA